MCSLWEVIRWAHGDMSPRMTSMALWEEGNRWVLSVRFVLSPHVTTCAILWQRGKVVFQTWVDAGSLTSQHAELWAKQTSNPSKLLSVRHLFTAKENWQAKSIKWHVTSLPSDQNTVVEPERNRILGQMMVLVCVPCGWWCANWS